MLYDKQRDRTFLCLYEVGAQRGIYLEYVPSRRGFYVGGHTDKSYPIQSYFIPLADFFRLLDIKLADVRKSWQDMTAQGWHSYKQWKPRHDPQDAPQALVPATRTSARHRG